jgi:PAS domain-containing protein
VLFGAVWIVASSLLVLLMARSISGPLATLHRGTRALMDSPENGGNFPLPVAVHNEIGDLIETFNRMVASIAEQRAGLNDTLSLLDSMLANAPIGLAFFDRRCRIVRVNQVFADMTGVPLSRHLGRTLPELLPQLVARELEDTVLRVFSPGRAGARPGTDRARWEAGAAVDVAGERLSGAHQSDAGALGGRDCAGCQRPQTQRRRLAQDGEAGCHGPAGGLDCARDQQSAGSDYQPAVSAAQLLRA